ncbi:sensor histidine kinase [Mucilaginibacter sp.]|uniref:sensor histidine kinase n=1 Tax=Mucilaginibacter sp. TaxID=1882438 RepID=UPI003565876A
METLVNSGVTFVFALFVWYYNIYTLPGYTTSYKNRGFSTFRLMRSLLIGLAVMFLLAYAQQLLLSSINFGPDMLMVEVRGILVNLTFYMFLHLLYQGYQNQQVSIELERTQADNLGAQYEMLKQQVNPHFLFNNMNTLKAMVETNDEHTVEFILKLSDFYRFTLESRKNDLIHLSDEVEILTAYMFLLKARFEDGINLVNTIDPQYYSSLIPPFTIQLLIENCIKHNIVSLDYPLQIKLYTENEKIIVENQLQPKKSQEFSTKVGLENINQRYIHLLDQKIDIEVNEKSFKIKLPVIHEHYHH